MTTTTNEEFKPFCDSFVTLLDVEHRVEMKNNSVTAILSLK